MSDTVRKIEGYETARFTKGPNSPIIHEFAENLDAFHPSQVVTPALLLISSGKTVPKYYTDEEVKKLLHQVFEKIEERRNEGESDLRQVRNDIRSIATKHGLEL